MRYSSGGAAFCTNFPPNFTRIFPQMATPFKTAQGTWRIQIEVRGVRDSGTFPTKREAVAWADKQKTELRAAATGQTGTMRTLTDALQKYGEVVSPTKRGEAKELVRLAAFLKPTHSPLPINKRMSEITTADLVAWRDARLAVTARGSVLRDMTLLGGVFEKARKEWQWISANPMRDVTRPAEPDHRQRIISGPEIRTMLRQLGYGFPVRTVSGAVAACFLLALMTGMRAGELCALRWPDVADDQVRLHTSKTGSGRDVSLSLGAHRLIERMRGWDADSVFGLLPQTLDALFRKARGRAGLEGFTFHDSRHTAATQIAQRLHVLGLCRVFGWRTTTQAMTYYQPKARDIARRLRNQGAGFPIQ